MRRDEINIRDPFVMPYNGKYYLYGTRSETCWSEAYGFDCYVSEDLKEFAGPYEIFHRPEGFFATTSYWAPECYEQNGQFFLLTTFGDANKRKGIYVLKAANPTGPFMLYSECLTPKDWSCIDGTLYFEKERVYLVYSHSFEDDPDASICYQEMSCDLHHCVAEPQTLFPAKSAPWAKPVPFARQEFGMEGDVYFSDGPCVFRVGETLYLTWSSWSLGSYAVGIAISESGCIEGPWRQLKHPLWKKNGGHGMVFEGPEKKRFFALHYPNDKGAEHPVFTELIGTEDELRLVSEETRENRRSL